MNVNDKYIDTIRRALIILEIYIENHTLPIMNNKDIVVIGDKKKIKTIAINDLENINELRKIMNM